MKKKIFILILLITVNLIIAQNTIYIDCTNSGYEDGTLEYTWNTIQEGIYDVEAGDDPSEIIVAEGEYVENIIVNPDGGAPRPITKISSESIDPNMCIIASENVGWYNAVVVFDDHDTENQLIFEGFTITHTNVESMRGIVIAEQIVSIRNCIIRNNTSYGIKHESGLSQEIINCDIVSNSDFGVYNGTNSIYTNCIIFSNNSGDYQIGGNFNEPTVTFSCIQNGYTGTGNTGANPQFADPNNGDYNLTDASPCVDTGDPSYPADPDGTTIDIGCYYFEHFYDIHRLSKGYNWESFPRIGIEDNNNDSTNIIPILEEIDPFGDIDNIYFDADGIYDLTYEYPYIWIPPSYLAQSSWLYKIEILPGEERILTINGERLPTNFDLSDEDPLEEGTKHWLGFWLPRNQKMIESFGDYWENVAKVYSEDWYYSPTINPRGGDPTYPCAISAENLILESGKGYMVLFKDLEGEPITDFHWTPSDAAEEPEKKSEPENFTYTEKADYEAIDVFNIPSNVTEIGVFEDDVCVGAVVVEDTCAQILVYSDNANREPIPFTLEVVTGRGFSTPIKDYQVLNLQTGEYETKSIFSGRQEYSILRFGDEDEPEDNTILTPQLYGNYPNPFNPTTTIEFALVQTSQFVTLEVFNIKGQKVKTLYKGIAEEGKHSMIWDGKDTNDKSVSTGIYFYKLKTGNDVLTRKMLMLK